MKIPALFAILMSGLSLAACGPAESGDEALVGNWVRTRDTGALRDRYTFAANGSFAFDENKPDQRDAEDHVLGTYAATDGVMTATATNNGQASTQVRVTFSYHAGSTQFTSVALLPRGAHHGVVGVWTSIARIEPLGDSSVGTEGGETELTFHADGTFYAVATTFDDGGSTKVMAGQWTAEAGDLFRIDWTDTDAVAVSHRFRLLDDAALADDGRIWARD